MGVEGPVPHFGELLKAGRGAKPPGKVQMPIAGRHAPFLPIAPPRIILDGAPSLVRRKRKARNQTAPCPGDIDSNQNPADVKDNRAQFSGRHRTIAFLWPIYPSASAEY